MYVSELSGHVIRKISPEGIHQMKMKICPFNLINLKGQVTTFAGCGYPGFLDEQYTMFNRPQSICLSQFHNSLLVCDCANHRVRMIDLKTGICLS